MKMKKVIYIISEYNTDECFTNLFAYEKKENALNKARDIIQEYINSWLEIEGNEDRICEWNMWCDLDEIKWNTPNWFLCRDWVVQVEVSEILVWDSEYENQKQKELDEKIKSWFIL